VLRVGQANSNYKTLNIGVPQGSILGPVLFLIYINDLPHVSDILSSILFADDTTLSLSKPRYSQLITTVNKELENINNYMLRNRLSVNVDKTFSMLFTNRCHAIDTTLAIQLDNKIVINRLQCKYLGLSIDNKLSFRFHVENISKKISKTVGIMYKLRPFVPDFVLLNLYYLIYCNIIWGGTGDVHLGQLKLLQKKFVRIITNSQFLDHTGS
jgi:hypothetical protein